MDPSGHASVEMTDLKKSQDEMSMLRKSLKNSQLKYSQMNVEDDDGYTESCSDNTQVILLDSGHMAFMKKMVLEQEERLKEQDEALGLSATKSSEEEEEKVVVAPTLLSSDDCCQASSNISMWPNNVRAHAMALHETLKQMPDHGIELLRRNVFWPMLAACSNVEDPDDATVALVLQCVLYVLSQPASSAVVATQLVADEEQSEHIATKLCKTGLQGLAVSARLTELSKLPVFLIKHLDAIRMSKQPFNDDDQLEFYGKSVLAVCIAYKDQTHYTLLCALRKYATSAASVHENIPLALALCKNKGIGYRDARQILLATVDRDSVREMLSTIWSHGLTMERLENLKREWV